MPNYRRALVPVTLLERRQTLLVDQIAGLREAVAKTRHRHPLHRRSIICMRSGRSHKATTIFRPAGG
jgi:REP-associated tyrosine transposase